MRWLLYLFFAFAMPVAAQSKAPDYAGEPLILEHSSVLFRYNADGTGDRTLSQTIHVQSEAAVRQFGVLQFAYASDSESAELHYVRVHKPDGAVVTTDPATAQDLTSEVARQAPLYSDEHQLQIPVRGLAVGDRVEYQAVFHTRKAEVPNQFWASFDLEKTAVAPDQQVELRFPAALHPTVLSPRNKPVISVEDGETIYRWRFSQTRPTVGVPKDDSPPAKQTPDVGWTTYASWDAVGAWYRAVAESRAAVTPEIQAKAAALTAGAATENEKMVRLYTFVSTQIRYVGVDFGAGRFQPHAAAEVMANGFGDCKDKHTLLAALLASAGIRAEPVLIGSGIDMDRALPAPNAFNHVITAVERPGGQRLWLDSTTEVAPAGLLLANLRDKDALLIPASGAATLVKTPAVAPFPLYDRWMAKGVLSGDGKLSSHFDVTLRGDWELILRAGLFSTGRAQWDQIGQNLSQAFGFGGVVTAFAAEHVDTPAEPLRLSYAYAREEYGDLANHRTLALLPPGLLALVEPDKQPPEPIDLGAPRTDSAHSVLTLPAGYSASPLPAPVHLSSPYFVLDIRSSMEGGDLVTEASMQVKQEKVPVKEWAQYKSFAKEANTHVGGWIDLEPVPVAKPGVAADSTGATAVSSLATVGTASSSPPAISLPSNPKAAVLLQEASQAAQSGNLDLARSKYEAARAINPDQPGMLLMAAALAASTRDYPAAEGDLKQAQLKYPGQLEPVLRMLFQVQVAENHPSEAVVTLESLRKLAPDDSMLTRVEAGLLTQAKRNEEAISLLEEANLRTPGDRATLLALGNAQIAAGRDREAEVSLRSALDGTEDPNVLNDAAYALAEHNVDLPLAGEKAHAALELVGEKTKSASVESLTRQDMSYQLLLSATWDTVGWLDYLEGKTAEAEPMLRAAWISTQRPVVGYHLGMIYEKAGKPAEAAEIYALARAAESSDKSYPEEANLRERREALERTGVHLHSSQLPAERLGQERSVELPLLVKQQSHADFLILANAKAVERVRFLEGDSVLSGQSKTVQDALTRNRAALEMPPGSGAKLVRRGTLFCSTLTHSCQFVVFLPADTRLPTQAASTAATALKEPATRTP